VDCADGRGELHAAAQWARATLDREPAARIAIVAQDLRAARNAITAELDDALCPGAAAHAISARPYNLSLGEPLVSTPVVHAALTSLELLRPRIPFSVASFVLRTPFLQAADSERSARAKLDIKLRQRVSENLTREGFRVLAAGSSPELPAMLQSVQMLAEAIPGRQKPSAWAATFAEALKRIGWPGARSPDSGEFQAVGALQEMLAGWVHLDGVLPSMGLGEALARLRRQATDAMFQPESGDTPVQVLGMLETAGLCFDHLWLLGLSDANWPESARPRAFIPPALQRQHGVPHASAALELGFAETVTRRLLACADDVVVSTPIREADTELRPSPLLAALPLRELAELPQAGVLSYREQLQRTHAEAVESYADERGPPLAMDGSPAGGTALIRSQAACPFQAFAWKRLAAEPLPEPGLGPDPRERGVLVHAALQQLWERLQDHAGLTKLDTSRRAELAGRMAELAVTERARQLPDVYPPRLASLEKQRLQDLLVAWLKQEAARPPFRVLMREAEQVLTLGPLVLNTRVDRIDELPEGGRLLLDYKTGRVRLDAWLDPRPQDPQLPLYAVTNAQGLAGLAFACLKPGAMGFTGLADHAGIAAGIADYAGYKYPPAGVDGWPALLDWWRRHLTALAEDYAAGDARVAPKDAETCERCHLTMLCRIRTLANAPLEEPDRGD